MSKLKKYGRLQPFNGAYFTKEGKVRNLDGHSGPGSDWKDVNFAPFCGVFIGHDGTHHDISELMNGTAGGIDMNDVNNAIGNALNNLPTGATQQDIDNAIQNAIKDFPTGATMAEVDQAISDAIAALPDKATMNQVQAAIDAAINALPDKATMNDVQAAIDAALLALPAGATQQDIDDAIANAIASFPAGVTMTAVNQAIANAMANLPTGTTPGDVQTLIDNAINALPNNLSMTDVNNAIQNAISQFPPSVTTSDMNTAITNAINNLPAGVSIGDVNSAISNAINALPNNLSMTDVNNAIQQALSQIPTGGGSNLDNIATMLMGDSSTFSISAINVKTNGTGYTVGDELTLATINETVTCEVTHVNANGGVLNVVFQPIVYTTDFATGSISIGCTGGSGTGAKFEVVTSYGVGFETIKGFLKLVPDADPLVQVSMLIGYVRDILNARFPIQTNDIADFAITPDKIDDGTITAGNGIQINKDSNGIIIQVDPNGQTGINVTITNYDQYGNLI